MRNEHEFKALVMQKVQQQRYQKQQRLQRIRAATISLSAVCLVLIGIASITWFVRNNPDMHTIQDGVFENAGAPKNEFFLLSGHSVTEDSTKEDLNNSPESNDANTGNGNNGSSPYNENGTGSEADRGNDPTNSVSSGASTPPNSLPQENAPDGFAYLQDINTEMASDLSLKAGKLKDTDAIVAQLEMILQSATPTEQTDQPTLFVLGFKNIYTGATYRFCKGNILVITQDNNHTSYSIKPAAYLHLLHLLQQAELITK